MALMLLLLVCALVWWLVLSVGLAWTITHPKRKTYAVALTRGEPTTPEEAGVAGREETWTLSDGAPSPGFLLWSKEAGEADPFASRANNANPNAIGSNEVRAPFPGAGVLVVHGFCDSRFGALGWAKPWLEALAMAGDGMKKETSKTQLPGGPVANLPGAGVVVFDQRGHGDAGGKVFGYGQKEAADVLCVLDQAMAATGIRDWVIAGLSAGTGVGLRAAVTAAEKAAEKDENDEGQAPRVVGFVGDGGYRMWDDPLVPLLKARGYPVKATVVGCWWLLKLLGVHLQDFDRAAWAGRLSVPSLFMHGDSDGLCPWQSAKQVADAAAKSPGAAGGRSDWVLFEDGGHLNLHELAPKRYVGQLAGWLKGHVLP